MEHNYDKWIGFFSGLAGGFIKFINAPLLEATFIGKLAEAGVTALVCGFLGIAGKNLYMWIAKKLKRKNNVGENK